MTNKSSSNQQHHAYLRCDGFDPALLTNPVYLKRHWPNWHALHEIFHRRVFSAQTASELLGIPYHKINDWDERGFIRCAQDNDGKHGWRKFSPLDLFGLAIIKEIRDLKLPLSLFDREEEGLREELPERLWEAMSFLVDGLPAYFQTNYRDTYSLVFTNDQKTRDGQRLTVNFEESDAVVAVVGLRRPARNLFSRLKCPDLEISIAEDGRYIFEKPDGKLLELEALRSPDQ